MTNDHDFHFFFFFNDTATTEIYTLSLHDALPIFSIIAGQRAQVRRAKKSVAQFKIREGMPIGARVTLRGDRMWEFIDRSEEHTSELQSRSDLVCRLLLEKKKKITIHRTHTAEFSR